MSEFDKSLLYERVCSELFHIITNLKSDAARAAERAVKDGEEVSQHYDIIKAELKKLLNKYRAMSDDAYKKHKENHPIISDYGLEELWNAVIVTAAQDYEVALCNKDKDTLKEVEEFLDRDCNILSRIRADYGKFIDKAHRDIESIMQVKPIVRKYHRGFNDPINKNRCPLCGGGMYVKSKLKTNVYLVACAGCELTEAVTVS